MSLLIDKVYRRRVHWWQRPSRVEYEDGHYWLSHRWPGPVGVAWPMYWAYRFHSWRCRRWSQWLRRLDNKQYEIEHPEQPPCPSCNGPDYLLMHRADGFRECVACGWKGNPR